LLVREGIVNGRLGFGIRLIRDWRNKFGIIYTLSVVSYNYFIYYVFLYQKK